MTSIAVTALTGFFSLSAFLGAANLTNKIPLEPAYPTYSVSMTGYNAVVGQTDSDPTITASGAFSNPDIIAARSVDLSEELPYGTVIGITAATTTPNCGYDVVHDFIGLRVIGDSMHPRMRNKIDIMFDTEDSVRARGQQMNPARVLGVCKDVQIAVVGRVDIKRMPRNQVELAAAVGFAELALR